MLGKWGYSVGKLGEIRVSSFLSAILSTSTEFQICFASPHLVHIQLQYNALNENYCQEHCPAIALLVEHYIRNCIHRFLAIPQPPLQLRH